jgi:DNA topoisomerase-2
MTSKRTTAIEANDYQDKDHRGHIYDIPDTYIGSDSKMERSEWVYDFETNTMKQKTITLPAGVERLFLEIISNAGDNAYTSRECGVDPVCIQISMNKHYISVRNYGNGIPIDKNDKGLMVPEMIFGQLLTSSNYDKNVIRMGCGRNGYGAKLTNIFSKEFCIHIGDATRKKQYAQQWDNNMLKKNPPVITPYTDKVNFVEVSYRLDFERFGYLTEPSSTNDYGYPHEAFELFTRFACDFSFSCKLPLEVSIEPLNFSKTFTLQSVRDFSSLYFPSSANNLYFKIWPNDIKGTLKEVKGHKGVFESDNPNDTPMLEVCLVDDPHNGTIVSYVNGLMSIKGGTHVDAVFNAITKPILNNVIVKKDNAKMTKLTMKDVKPHLSMLVNCRIGDPKYDSQTKSSLVSPSMKIDVADTVLEPIAKWSIIDHLYASLELKNLRKLSESDGKKSRYVTFKGEDANEAGGGNSERCTLFIVEGMSAMGYCVKAIEYIENGRDYFGVFPLKGKPLNVMNANVEKIYENKEIADLKKALGLVEGRDYTNIQEFKSLRYGHVVILADSDDDGKHIIGLTLNVFHCRFPSLLKRGYVKFLRTPILRVFKGAQVETFFTFNDYFRWQKHNENTYTLWKHKYFKGLGTSTNEHIKDDFKDPRQVVCVYDKEARNRFELAFHNKLANDRKRWIAEWSTELNIDSVIKTIPITKFFDTEFREYSVAHVHRAIPRFMDGLKTSQRKALWSAFKKWAGTETMMKKRPEEMKVARFAAYVATETKYHHGETNMADTLVGMAQDFTGANNLPYFTRDGQFGTRNLGGKDAASPRYIELRPEWWLNYVYRKEDLPLHELTKDDGEDVEPVTLLPIIPMILINGCLGIGTGHSTFIPNHNPIKIVSWLKARLGGKKGKSLPHVYPWYRGFNGTLMLTKKKIKDKKGEMLPNEIEDAIKGGEMLIEGENGIVESEALQELIKEAVDDENDIGSTTSSNDEREKVSLVSIGNYYQEGGRIIVNELPIGRWINHYYEFLRLEREKKGEDKWVSDFRNCSTSSDPKFIITMAGNSVPSREQLRLVKSFGMSNMVVLTDDNVPYRFDTTNDILEAFYENRLPYYQARKDYLIASLQADIDKFSLRAKFIDLVLTEQLIVFKRKKDDIYTDMEKLKLPIEARELLKSVNLYNLSYDDIEELEKKTVSLKIKRDTLSNKTPEELWSDDLLEFEQEYVKIYAQDV